MLMSDSWIEKQSIQNNMIAPFFKRESMESSSNVLSYGLSSYGYDTRLANEFKIFTNLNSTIVDPKNFSNKNFFSKVGDSCIIPPNSFVLGKSIEYFKIPEDVLVICLGKSTYARCGIIVNVTPLEPGWEGHITLEFSNTTPLPAKLYANEGVCQLIFLKGEQKCAISYLKKKGKYMYQKDITLPKV
ncbi:MAG: dCTP deaminase [Rickettsia sp.]|nr:dCTP deaminase [Rickettsia sp.]